MSFTNYLHYHVITPYENLNGRPYDKLFLALTSSI